MVVAQLPLWIVHGGRESTPPPSLSATTPPAATTSLHRLQSARCAIYSIDIHPNGNILATAGGDGAVRVWQTSELMTSTDDNRSETIRKSAHFDGDGRYVSSESESDSSHCGSNSKGIDKDTECIASASDGRARPQPLPLQTVQKPVHDLNAAVRRKSGTEPRPSQLSTAPTFNVDPDPTSHASWATTTPSSSNRLICTLSAHTGSSVLCVRFSCSGDLLASAGDDGCVCLYAPRTNRSLNKKHGSLKNCGSESIDSILEWSRVKLCRGHGLDVVDLAWAPDDTYLISCSLDSATPIIVWKTNDLNSSHAGGSMILSPFKILGQNVHTSTVKGVSFDPAGSYFASSGDDPAVCIWRAHDDWGLQAKIDDSHGIFRSWRNSKTNVDESTASQSLVRRISWSTDGAFVVSTNSVVKNKHVASTISRQGWVTSCTGKRNSDNTAQAAGAANLVGHKQPIVCSRHSPRLLHVKRQTAAEPDDSSNKSNRSQKLSEKEEDSDDVPDYATLLALGDRRGFITVWSTRKSRPLFKLQCSESHCTVTDLAWGHSANSLLLFVSLLDGHVVALRFGVPDELGDVLSSQDSSRVFQERYGIDIGIHGGRRTFVGGSGTGPKLIENALQMTLEEEAATSTKAGAELEQTSAAATLPVQHQRQKSVGLATKKRIRPIFLPVDTGPSPALVKPKISPSLAPTDPVQTAVDAAQRASAVTLTGQATTNVATTMEPKTVLENALDSTANTSNMSRSMARNTSTVPALAHSVDKIYSLELDFPNDSRGDTLDFIDGLRDGGAYIAECVNTTKVPTGSKGGAMPCIDLSISNCGRITYKDQIPGASCCAVAVSQNLLAIGTVDGSILMYGTSPTLKWACGTAFRSHAPLIIGHPIVSIQLRDLEGVTRRSDDSLGPTPNDANRLEMLVVASDGSFGVYTIIPDLALQYKGTIVQAMMHMSLSLGVTNQACDAQLPKLSRAQITEYGSLLLLLSFDSDAERSKTSIDGSPGGSMQAFLYDRQLELWMRISDSRFVLSDFYSALPLSSRFDFGADNQATLSNVDDMVRLGSLHSSLKAAHRGRFGNNRLTIASAIYNQDDTGEVFVTTRSHCEDRMACSIALGSAAEFKQWLSLYVRLLTIRGKASQIRMLVDMLLCVSTQKTVMNENGGARNDKAWISESWWWLSKAPTILRLDRISLVKTLVIPEMSKNREMQRLTNEISLEIESL